MDVFTFQDYKSLVRAWIHNQPKQGYGQFRKMAESLGVGSVLISQIFKGDRDLNLDQAHKLTLHMTLTHLETDYFLLLVQWARAETPDLREFLRTKIEILQKNSQSLKNRIDTDAELSEVDKARFHSDWLYSGIRNLIAVPGYQDVKKISTKLDLPLSVVQEAVDFLLQTGLCRLQKGKIEVGPKITHLEASSPFIKNRQIQWRMKAIDAMNHRESNHLFYTCPMSLSVKTKQEVRDRLLQAIQEIIADVKESPSEEVACLNIDWFGF